MTTSLDCLMRHENSDLVPRAERLRDALRTLAGHTRGPDRSRLIATSLSLAEACATVFEVSSLERRFAILERALVAAAKLAVVLRGLAFPSPSREVARCLKDLRDVAARVSQRRDAVASQLRGGVVSVEPLVDPEAPPRGRRRERGPVPAGAAKPSAEAPEGLAPSPVTDESEGEKQAPLAGGRDDLPARGTMFEGRLLDREHVEDQRLNVVDAQVLGGAVDVETT